MGWRSWNSTDRSPLRQCTSDAPLTWP